MTEQIIIKRIRARDPAGLEALMDRYIPYVSAIVWNILRFSMQPEDAEEVISDVFLAAWNQAEDLQSGKVKAWLAGVARNTARMKLREIGQELPLEEDVLQLPDQAGPEATLEKTEERFLVSIPMVRRSRDIFPSLQIRPSSWMNLPASNSPTEPRFP